MSMTRKEPPGDGSVFMDRNDEDEDDFFREPFDSLRSIEAGPPGEPISETRKIF